MLKFSNSPTNTRNNENGEPVNSTSSIKVLVVDQMKEFISYVEEALHSCSFEVTCVDESGTALRLLSEKTSEFDLLLIDCNMSDVDIHTFLQLTKNMDVLSIMMSQQVNNELSLEALKNGAFLVIKKPLTREAVSHMRQDVIRERMRRHENYRNKNIIIKGETQELGIPETGSWGSKRMDRGESSKQVTGSNFESNLVFSLSEEDDVRSMKKKICVEWTQELHAKFLSAVIRLGEGRCYPKNILDLMDVPGLTRMQVASHLQKCRREKWKSDEKWLSFLSSWNHKMLFGNLPTKRVNQRKFGCMPSLEMNSYDQEESSKPIGFNFLMNGWQKEANHMKNQTERGSIIMTKLNQKNTEQCTQYTPFLVQSGYGSKQDEGFGRIFTKPAHNYFQQEIPGLHDAGQGTDHHAFSSDQRQASDDFPDFLRDLYGNGPNDILTNENIALGHNHVTPKQERSKPPYLTMEARNFKDDQ